MKVRLLVLCMFGLFLIQHSFITLNACPTCICEIGECQPIEEESYESDEE